MPVNRISAPNTFVHCHLGVKNGDYLPSVALWIFFCYQTLKEVLHYKMFRAIVEESV